MRRSFRPLFAFTRPISLVAFGLSVLSACTWDPIGSIRIVREPVERIEPGVSAALAAAPAVPHAIWALGSDGSTNHDRVVDALVRRHLARRRPDGGLWVADAVLERSWFVTVDYAALDVGTARPGPVTGYDHNLTEFGEIGYMERLDVVSRIEPAAWLRIPATTSIERPLEIDGPQDNDPARRGHLLARRPFSNDLTLAMDPAALARSMEDQMTEGQSPVAGSGEFDDPQTATCPASATIAQTRLRFRIALFSQRERGMAGEAAALPLAWKLATLFAACAQDRSLPHRAAWAATWASDARILARSFEPERDHDAPSAQRDRLGDSDDARTLVRLAHGRYADVAAFARWAWTQQFGYTGEMPVR